MRPALPFLILLVSGLAGCADDGPPPDNQARADLADADVFGLVLDGDGERLPGATVTLPELDLATTSGADGSYAFETGDYAGTTTILATMMDRHDVEARIQVGDAFVAQVVFRLFRLDELPPVDIVQEHSVYLPCRVFAAGVPSDCSTDPGSARDTFVQGIPIDGEQPTGIVFEMFWDEAMLGNNALRLTVAPGTPLERTVEGPAPSLRIEYSQEEMEGFADLAEIAFEVDVGDAGDGLGTVFQQRAQVLVTRFFNQPAPVDYSVLDG